jgi:hypothetical protein
MISLLCRSLSHIGNRFAHLSNVSVNKAADAKPNASNDNQVPTRRGGD